MFLGQLAGGALVRMCNSAVKKILKLNIFVTAISMALAGSLLVGCELNPIAGVSVPYDVIRLQTTNGSEILPWKCNSDCHCSTASYDPVCINGVEYFTPCHAGCSIDLNATSQVLYNCTCPSSAMSGDTRRALTAVRGKCTSSCNNIYIFLPLIGLVVFCTFSLLVPATTVVLRSVDSSQTSMAIAAEQFLMRLFGSVPGLLLLGGLLDNSCLVWQEKCEDAGSCAIYDNSLMGVSAFTAVILGKTLSLIALCLAFRLHTPLAADEENCADRLEYDLCHE
ncbi:solute carrier organic anion transporter family member 4C1-like [Watersipora subatra]|uniref:solute carrier organic anion transporter family member 4C1-like n=1 Tax=Watersipora subatra TaxID=2589382 RepID=UPI00355B1D3D